MKYSIGKGIVKVLKSFVLFIVPVLVNYLIVEYPQIYQVSAGALLVGVVNFLKVKGVPVIKSL